MEKAQSLITIPRRSLTLLLTLVVTGLTALAGQRPVENGTLVRVAADNPTLAAARRRVLSARPLGMYYYAGDTQGLESIRAHANEMTLVAPQCYWIEKDGVVRGELPPGLSEIAARTGLAIMPLVYNRGFDRETVTALLHSAQAQERAVSYLAYLAWRENTVGFQIDFENIAPKDQRLFTEFVRRAAVRLHRDGRLLSVAVVPRFADGPPSPPRPGKPSSGEWSAAFDYRALGHAADFLSLMTYDHSNRSSPPGPIAGYEWVRHALDYATARVAPIKLLMGLPLYGREWVRDSDDTMSRSLNGRDLRELLARPGIKIRWDERWRSPWFEFREAGRLHTVWYEDRRSWTEKLRLMRLYHLRGFAAWRLGVEDSDFWTLQTVRSVGRPERHAHRAGASDIRDRSSEARETGRRAP